MRSLLILFLALITLCAQADENWYAKHYQTQTKGQLVSIQPEPRTEIYVGKSRQEDNINMLEQGYDLMGTSSFEAADVPPEQALAHGKEIKADKVLVYVTKSRKKTPIGQMEFIREARKSGKELTEKDFQDVPNYRYYASYWAKLPSPLLGLHVIKLVPKDVDIAPEEGVNVIAVIQGSPAAQAGLQKGDVLLALDGKAVNRPEELAVLVGELQGRSVPMEILRDGEKKTLQAQINQR
jgi:hypothetical protein